MGPTTARLCSGLVAMIWSNQGARKFNTVQVDILEGTENDAFAAFDKGEIDVLFAGSKAMVRHTDVFISRPVFFDGAGCIGDIAL
jgi:hypothetical protein